MPGSADVGRLEVGAGQVRVGDKGPSGRLAFERTTETAEVLAAIHAHLGDEDRRFCRLERKDGPGSTADSVVRRIPASVRSARSEPFGLHYRHAI